MCGIHASISKVDHVRPSAELRKLLSQRGPDYLGSNETTTTNTTVPNYLTFTSTVLALRGGHVTAQPFVDPGTGSMFCWNGEAWNISGAAVEGNDGEKVFRMLVEATCVASDRKMAIQAVLAVISSISGPFAFVYFDKVFNCIYFGRDRLGRRSLLFNLDADSRAVQFSSVAEPSQSGWAEVEADGVYLLSYVDEEIESANETGEILVSNSDYRLHHHTWSVADGLSGSSVSTISNVARTFYLALVQCIQCYLYKPIFLVLLIEKSL